MILEISYYFKYNLVEMLIFIYSCYIHEKKYSHTWV